MPVTETGLAALRRQIDQLPTDVTTALRGVAQGTAVRIKDRARALAPVSVGPRRGHTEGQPHLRDSIEIRADAAQQAFHVEPNTPWLPNLGLWIERGTRFQSARPFMRPAGDAENERYRAEMLTAAARVIAKVGD